ncbi:hypothetical protein L1887_27896 [Cichorium endivia]|nr:hypothetical protein L1887_27896 [Cichorium endivia]
MYSTKWKLVFLDPSVTSPLKNDDYEVLIQPDVNRRRRRRNGEVVEALIGFDGKPSMADFARKDETIDFVVLYGVKMSLT